MLHSLNTLATTPTPGTGFARDYTNATLGVLRTNKRIAAAYWSRDSRTYPSCASWQNFASIENMTFRDLKCFDGLRQLHCAHRKTLQLFLIFCAPICVSKEWRNEQKICCHPCFTVRVVLNWQFFTVLEAPWIRGYPDHNRHLFKK
jgi:hypothetical protein